MVLVELLFWTFLAAILCMFIVNTVAIGVLMFDIICAARVAIERRRTILDKMRKS